MSTTRKIIIALGVVIVAGFFGLLIIGAVAYGLYSSSTSDSEMVFAPTEVGTPVGNKITKDIGPEGGTLVSPDGRLTLTVPQNAVTEIVPFSIQPITNKAKDGLGLAYRMAPDGMTFGTPLQISFRYDEHDLEGTVPETFSLAYQDAKGAWHLQKATKLDQAAKTLTIGTTHFTDFAALTGLRMSPATATLHVGEYLEIYLAQCKKQKLWPRRLPCDHYAPDGEGEWKLSGPGKLNEVLVLSDDYDESTWGAQYQAPAKKPTPNVSRVDLTIDFELWNPLTGETKSVRKTFATKITIIDWAYKVSGNAGGDTLISGNICDLEKQFILKTSNPFLSALEFDPLSSTEGTFSFFTKNGIKGYGGGSYKIIGTDTLKTGIEMNSMSFGTGPVGPTLTGNGPVHLDLVPLKKCGK